MLFDFSFISQSIDEDHNLFNINNIRGFQPHNLGGNPRKDNEYYLCNSPHRFHSLPCSYTSFFLTPSIKPRLWKIIPLRMWLWPCWICPPPLFFTILSSCHLIPPFWSRNCTFTPNPLSWSIRQPLPNFPMDLLCSSFTYPRPNLWVTPRRTRMGRIGG